MVAVTYGAARVSAGKAKAKTGRTARAAPKTWFTCFMEALIESRLQQARREIARHAHFMSHRVDGSGNRQGKNVPFGGW